MIFQTHRAFSLVELLVVIAVIGILAVLGIGVARKTLDGAERADSIARLRSVGQAVQLYAGEHQYQLPGPLWPGQIMLYDAGRDGRIVRDLAPYLGVEHRDTPYLVGSMIPKAYRRLSSGGVVDELRVYVMNSSIELDGQTLLPFGSLTDSPEVAPMRIANLSNLPEGEGWMISETDQKHPDVAGAPWKAHTPEEPVHDGSRVVVNFDGSAGFEIVP